MTFRPSLSSLLILTLAACSPITPKGDADGGNNNDDGGGGNPDAEVSYDAAPGIATVRVFDDNLDPIMGAKVLFSNRDGSQISVKTTSAAGETSETVPEGAVVTVAVAQQDIGATYARYKLYQIHDVQPGDQVEIGPRGIRADWSSLGSSRVQLSGEYAGSDHYEIGTGCTAYTVNSGNPVLDLDYSFQNDDCHGTAARRDLLSYAWADSAETNLLAWTTIDDVQLGNTTPTVSGAWNTLFDNVTFTVSNFPFTGQAEARLRQFKTNIDYSLDDSGGGSVAMGGSVVVSKKLPRGFADGLQVAVQGFGMNGGNAVISFFVSNVQRSQSSHMVDLGALGYPSFTGVQVDVTAPNTPKLTWTETGAAPSSAEARIGYVRWSEPTSNDEWEWQILLPLGASSPVTSPTLPANFLTNPGSGSNAWPPPSSAVTETIAAGMVEFGDLDGWDEVRQQRGLAVFGDDGNFLSPSAPVGSTTVLWAGGLIQFN